MTYAQFLFVRTEQIQPLITALETRNAYLQGLIRRQLEYRPTATRNRKLEALEEEQLLIEGLYHQALAELKPILDKAAAPDGATPKMMFRTLPTDNNNLFSKDEILMP